MIWLQFVISSALIVAAGARLTTYADILGDRLGVGKVWIGVILLGIVTSLPEAVASLTAVIALDAVDLAVGNIAGSNCFNLVLIAILDLAYGKGSVTNKVQFNRSHLMSAFFAALLAFIVAGEILLSGRGISFAFGPVGLGSLFIFVIYFWGVRHLAHLGFLEGHLAQAPGEIAGRPLGKIYLNVFGCAVVVVVAAVWLTNAADTIAVTTGLGRTFVGTIFLAFATSLPEMVVTVSAVKLGVLDLAIGNIFGSNMINVFFIPFCDVFYLKGVLLAAVSKTHAVTAGLSIVLTGIAVAGLRKTRKKTFLRLSYDSFLLILVFVVGMAFVYRLK